MSLTDRKLLERLNQAKAMSDFDNSKNSVYQFGLFVRRVYTRVHDLMEIGIQELERMDMDRWWCPTCMIQPPEVEVTFNEHHEICGTYIGDF